MKKDINLFVDKALVKIHSKKSHRAIMLVGVFCFAVLAIITIPLVVYSAVQNKNNQRSTITKDLSLSSLPQILNNYVLSSSSLSSSFSSTSSENNLKSFDSKEFYLSFSYSNDFDISEYKDEIYMQSLKSSNFEIHIYKGDLKNLKSNFSAGKFIKDEKYINAIDINGILYNVQKFVRIESDIDPDSGYLRLKVSKEFYEIKFTDNISIIYYIQNEQKLSGTSIKKENYVPAEVITDGMKIIESIKVN